jgi:hypothetical protein
MRAMILLLVIGEKMSVIDQRFYLQSEGQAVAGDAKSGEILHKRAQVCTEVLGEFG